eukprot:CAMPEP_0205926920 /NCGR_PEP_ID=MMETSP1325-20131115/21489_1 /ASSEMBLY_ACC=CAM_ASM_000708 /TAXON_ID=236786 /ORGANISM="Florenciella sp., Strain RCC1007" /LENGTH=55 /DNA_ID=CAMNT_0053295711 /DNA_START=26 /DNA_END=193 /DNA_ORIENTATION=+
MEAFEETAKDQLEDEVGWGMYGAIGVAICTVIIMYGWMGYTLYMGLKEERERKKN